MSEFWEKVSFKSTPKIPKKVKVDFYKRKPQRKTKPSKIYIVFESDTLSPMEILIPMKEKAEELGIRTPDYLVLDYQGCDDPGTISVQYTEVRTT